MSYGARVSGHGPRASGGRGVVSGCWAELRLLLRITAEGVGLECRAVLVVGKGRWWPALVKVALLDKLTPLVDDYSPSCSHELFAGGARPGR